MKGIISLALFFLVSCSLKAQFPCYGYEFHVVDSGGRFLMVTCEDSIVVMHKVPPQKIETSKKDLTREGARYGGFYLRWGCEGDELKFALITIKYNGYKMRLISEQGLPMIDDTNGWLTDQVTFVPNTIQYFQGKFNSKHKSLFRITPVK